MVILGDAMRKYQWKPSCYWGFPQRAVFKERLPARTTLLHDAKKTQSINLVGWPHCAWHARKTVARAKVRLLMCLGVPGRVLSIDGNTCQVDFWGVRRSILVMTVDEPLVPGDYVLVHVGFAIRRIPEQDIEETLEFYQLILNSENNADLMTADVKGEIDASL